MEPSRALEVTFEDATEISGGIPRTIAAPNFEGPFGGQLDCQDVCVYLGVWLTSRGV